MMTNGRKMLAALAGLLLLIVAACTPQQRAAAISAAELAARVCSAAESAEDCAERLLFELAAPCACEELHETPCPELPPLVQAQPPSVPELGPQNEQPEQYAEPESQLEQAENP